MKTANERRLRHKLRHKRGAARDSNSGPPACKLVSPFPLFPPFPFIYMGLHQFREPAFATPGNPFSLNNMDFWNSFGTAAALPRGPAQAEKDGVVLQE